MVEQMLDPKFSKYVLENCVSTLPSTEKEPPLSLKNTTLQDVQNDNRTVLPKPFGNFASRRETESTEDATQVLIAKSPRKDNLLDPPRLQSQGSINPNLHLVYARRKSDAELTNRRKNHSANCQQSKQFSDKKVIPQPQIKIKEPNSGSVAAFAPIPVNYTAASCGTAALLPDSVRKHDRGQLTIANSVPCSEDSRVRGDQHWRDRFIQLQKYLKHCDNSNQEAYIQKLQSWTSDECSRHAVELERRAIHLMLEEGREIKRMKYLSVIGKSAANQYL